MRTCKYVFFFLTCQICMYISTNPSVGQNGKSSIYRGYTKCPYMPVYVRSARFNFIHIHLCIYHFYLLYIFMYSFRSIMVYRHTQATCFSTKNDVSEVNMRLLSIYFHSVYLLTRKRNAAKFFKQI